MKLLHFKAAWCSPCKNLSKLLENVKFPYERQIIDIDEDIETALIYNVRSVPMLILVNDDNDIIQSHTGMLTVSELKNKFFDIVGE